MNYHNIEFLTSYGLRAQLTKRSCAEIVFLGRSNVGKSSLINKLFNRKNLARVSGTPGKTATINFFQWNDVMVVDLPGYGYAKVSKGEKKRWAELLDGYFGEPRKIALAILLLDIRHAPSSDDQMMLNYLIESPYPFIVVLTKADKLKKGQQEKRVLEFMSEIPYGDQITIVRTSSSKGTGMEDVKEIIEMALNEFAQQETCEGEIRGKKDEQ